MVDVFEVIRSWPDSTGAICAKLELQVSTVANLPSIGDVVGGMKVQAGSFAQIIRAGTWYTLDDNGTWYDSDGTAASGTSSLNASLSMSPTLGKAITDSKEDTIDPTEVDRISDELEKAEEPAVKEQKKEYVESIEEPEEKDGEDGAELL